MSKEIYVICDEPSCGKKSLLDKATNWLSLTHLAMAPMTWTGADKPLCGDFCSLECLKKRIAYFEASPEPAYAGDMVLQIAPTNRGQ